MVVGAILDSGLSACWAADGDTHPLTSMQVSAPANRKWHIAFLPFAGGYYPRRFFDTTVLRSPGGDDGAGTSDPLRPLDLTAYRGTTATVIIVLPSKLSPKMLLDLSPFPFGAQKRHFVENP